MTIAIELVKLSREFTAGAAVIRAVDAIDLTVERGDFIAVAGPSGSGKSTLLYLIGGLEKPTAGTVRVDGADLAAMTERQKARYRGEKIGFIFQEFNLMNHLKAIENVQLPLMLAGVPPRRRTERARSALAAVGLDHRGGHLSGELSGGERQRVAIARALAGEPAILLADEPTGNLDSASGGRVMDIIERLNREEHLTTLVVTHDPAVASRAGRTLRIVDGRLDE